MTADNFVREEVAMWVDCVEKLTKAATKSLLSPNPFMQCEWTYLQQVMHNCELRCLCPTARYDF